MLAGLGFIVLVMAWAEMGALRIGLLAAIEKAVERLTASPEIAQVFLVSAVGACGCTALEKSVFRREERALPVTSVVFAGAGAVLALTALVLFRQPDVVPLWTEMALYAGAASQMLLYGAVVLGRAAKTSANAPEVQGCPWDGWQQGDMR